MSKKFQIKGFFPKQKTKNTDSKSLKLFRVRKLGWAFGFSIVIVIGSIMAFGLITYVFDLISTETAIYMLGMIAPMGTIVFFSIRHILRQMDKKLLPLANGLQKIADGDTDVNLDVNEAGEYEILYKNFNLMSKELQATKDEMQGFVNSFAHEFKTPITSISGFADLLYEEWDNISPDEREEYLKIISEQSHRLESLSRNTLLLSKVDATQIITDKKEFLLSDQISRCGILLLKECEKKNIELDIEDEVDIKYTGNEELMEQIWINLLNNAIKFTKPGGTVSVRYQVAADKISVMVSDTGIGMSEDTKAHIFEKYYQNDTVNIVKGNGIGLSIVKRIVDLCGGEIEVTSEPDQGSTFTVIL